MKPLQQARGELSCLHPELLSSPQYLPEATFEQEMLLWRRFLDNKVLLSFGKAFECKEPGWFRLVFSDRMHRLRLGEASPLLTASFSLPSLLGCTCSPAA